MRQFATIAEMSGGCVFVESDTQQRRRAGDKAAISFYCAVVKV